MAKRIRKRYSAEKKAEILAAAKKDGLTAEGVKKRFGVTPVTYYSWRKKSGATRVSRAVRTSSASSLDQVLRKQVRERITKLLPEIIRSELGAHLNSLLGGSGKRRGRPRKRK